MIQDKLQKILAVKADIKSALTNAGIENPGDIFADYPDMIRNLKAEDIYAEFFVLVPDEYIEEKISDYKIGLYEKYRYIYSDDIYVKGQLVREDNAYILKYESLVPNCISITYQGIDGNKYKAESVNNTIYYNENMGESMEVTHISCPFDTITKVIYLDYDIIHYKDVMQYMLRDNYNECDVEMFKAEKIESLSFTWNGISGLNSLKTRLGKTTNIEKYLAGTGIKYVVFENDDLVETTSNLFYTPNNSIKYVNMSGSNIQNSDSMVKSCSNLEEVCFRNPTINLSNCNSMFYKCTNLKSVYNLDYSNMPSGSPFQDCTNLIHCKIHNLNTSSSLSYKRGAGLPPSEVWAEEDIIYTFRNALPVENKKIIIDSRTYTILEENNIISELTSKGWTVTKS